MSFESDIQELCHAVRVPVPDKFEVRGGPWHCTESESDQLIRQRVYNDLERLVPMWAHAPVLGPLRQKLFEGPWSRPDIMTGRGFGWASSEVVSYYEAVEALYPHKLARLLNSLCRQKFFFTVGPQIVTICESPVKYSLHDEKGPAVEFPDGQKFHVLQGVLVPSFWPDFKNLTGPQWSVLGDKLEWTGVWSKIPFEKRLVDRDPDPLIGTLWGVRFFDPESKFLEVLCPTGRVFFLRVPHDTRTAMEAQERLWGLSENAYRPTIQL